MKVLNSIDPSTDTTHHRFPLDTKPLFNFLEVTIQPVPQPFNSLQVSVQHVLGDCVGDTVHVLPLVPGLFMETLAGLGGHSAL